MDKDHLAGHASINSWLMQLTVMARLNFGEVLAETIALAERAGEPDPPAYARQAIEEWLAWLDTNHVHTGAALRKRYTAALSV